MKDDLPKQEWDFGSVPDGEMVACCYWEFARESAFIRGVRQRCLGPEWKKMVNSELGEYCGHDIEKIQSIGYASEVFLRGFFCPPDGVLHDAPPLKPREVRPLTGSFPQAWQALTKEERAYRSHIGNDVERIPLVPFKRGISLDAQDIREWTSKQAAEAEAERQRVQRENPRLNEETLQRLGMLKFPAIKPSLYYASGKEVTVVGINWGAFTNDEIVNYFRRWVKANRPPDYPVPSRKGHKPGDWRANLTRLAVMRLLSRFTALELVEKDRFPAIWRTKQYAGRKWGDVTKWHDARREAGKLFHSLFPFLPTEEKPLSWTRQAPAN